MMEIQIDYPSPSQEEEIIHLHDAPAVPVGLFTSELQGLLNGSEARRRRTYRVVRHMQAIVSSSLAGGDNRSGSPS